VFNGSRFRSEIAPRISDFVLSNNGPRRKANGAAPAPSKAKAAAH
jgi:poly(3-hydroxybutyrate) depolymerase